MIYTSDRTVNYPRLDLLTYLFDCPESLAIETTVLHCDAENPERAITKSTARELTKSIAYSLRHQFGVGANGPEKDVVVVVSSGQPLLPVVFYGVVAAGGVYSAASASFTPSELSRQIKQGNSKLILCSEDAKEVTVKAAGDCGVPLDRVMVIKSRPEWSIKSIDGQITCLPSKGKLDWVRITDEKRLEMSLICLLYSSGTTGVPKGVEISHTNMVSQSYIPAIYLKEKIRAQLASGLPPLQYRTIAHLPAAHIAGVQGYFVNPFHMGGTTYWMPKFDFVKFLEYSKQYRATLLLSVPPVWLAVAKSPLVTDQFSDVESAVSAAAPMGKELQKAASEKLGKGTFINQTWGLSETTGSVTLMPTGEIDDTGSVSKLLPNMSVRFIDDDGKDVIEGQPGEILVKGPVVINGYYGNPKATKELFIDGWLCTGDIGVWKNGLVHIVDRKKELIKYKGIQVAPAEIEALLISHPLILDAAVIGVPISDATEAPRAYVVKGGEITEDEVKDFVKANLSSPKWLRGGVVFVDAVPKSASGKILRRELRERVRMEGEKEKAKL